jgi:hypothetical protein
VDRVSWLGSVPVIAFALSILVISPQSANAAPCSFALGFKSLHDLIPEQVGACLVDEHHNPTNGDGLQETAGPTGAGGLLVWRKADNWTAFTDGYHTWINGAFGLERRLNVQLFWWESGATSDNAAPESALEHAVCDSLPGSATGQPAASCFRIFANQLGPPRATVKPTPTVAPVRPPTGAPNGNIVTSGLYRVQLTRLDDDFYQDESGVLFETSDCYEYSYGDSAIFDADNMSILFSSETCDVSEVATQYVNSRIEWDFDGYESDAIFLLTNGQIWQQTSSRYHYHYSYRPDAFVYVGDTGWVIHVIGAGESVRVTRRA